MTPLRGSRGSGPNLPWWRFPLFPYYGLKDLSDIILAHHHVHVPTPQRHMHMYMYAHMNLLIYMYYLTCTCTHNPRAMRSTWKSPLLNMNRIYFRSGLLWAWAPQTLKRLADLRAGSNVPPVPHHSCQNGRAVDSGANTLVRTPRRIGSRDPPAPPRRTSRPRHRPSAGPGTRPTRRGHARRGGRHRTRRERYANLAG